MAVLRQFQTRLESLPAAQEKSSLVSVGASLEEWTSTTKALRIVPVIRYGGCFPTLLPMDTCRMHVAEALSDLA